MRTTTAIPTEIKAGATLKVLMNHIYELHKGVRHMVLFTCNKKYSELAIVSGIASVRGSVKGNAKVSVKSVSTEINNFLE